MKHSLSFFRLFFFVFSLMLTCGTYFSMQEEITFSTIGVGVSLGMGVAAFLFFVDLVFRKFPLLSFNTTLLGLFFGYLMGLALLAIFHTLLSIVPLVLRENIVSFVQIILFLSGLYLGVMMTIRASHEIAFSLPFMKFSPAQVKTKEILLDPSVLGDERLLDLAASGLMDGRVILPRFLLKELEGETTKEGEILRKLEGLPDLHMRYHDTDFPELKESVQKIFKLGRLLNADILTADLKMIPHGSTEGVRVINLHALASALKPMMQRGEYLNIKIQRYGKEERQGVGYLEDGTMIVVNGGGDYIGKTIRACVLSMKHTTTGRMIFCNVAEEAAVS